MHLPLSLFGRFKVGQAYGLMGDEPIRKKIEERLKIVDPVIDLASRAFRCVFQIDNKGKTLPVGFTAQLPVAHVNEMLSSASE